MVEPGIVATASFKGPSPNGFKVGYPRSAQTEVSYFPREHPKIYFWNARSVALRQQKLFKKNHPCFVSFDVSQAEIWFSYPSPSALVFLSLAHSLWLSLSHSVIFLARGNGAGDKMPFDR